jgi:methylated-DNA-[protein]-cysteine S-methyltransferase
MPQLSFHTPLGALTLSEEDGAIVALDWGFGRDQTSTPLLEQGRAQLQAYFDGDLKQFDLPLAPYGSAYSQRVWQALREIPYGHTASYATIAARAGGSARSVGGANSRNPIPILIPCHRVVGSRHVEGSGGAGGYSGGDGIETKLWLLSLEQGMPPLLGAQPLRGQPDACLEER